MKNETINITNSTEQISVKKLARREDKAKRLNYIYKPYTVFLSSYFKITPDFGYLGRI